MKYLHTMVRVTNLKASLDFYCDKLGLQEIRRREDQNGRYTLVYLCAPGDKNAQVELTHNWDPEPYTGGRNFGHLAYEVSDIYATCEQLMAGGVTINRPPRDGRMAFVRSPEPIRRAAPLARCSSDQVRILRPQGCVEPQSVTAP